ncbi:MAG: fructosamine kinase family protein [Cyanobacteria bacterium HKST-UBA03]|nr:fructosamine kinase family protein [Cyanobacteria bacterium HKST-UBA03]
MTTHPPAITPIAHIQAPAVLPLDQVSRVTPLSGGCLSPVYQVGFSSTRPPVVVKLDDTASGQLLTEAWMLRYLADVGQVPTPTVLDATAQWLIMDWCPNEGGLNAETEVDIAYHIARLHRCSSSRFGLFDEAGQPKHTVIGPLHQPNKSTEPTDSWLSFFATHRLLYMADAAYREGKLPKHLLHCLHRFAEQMSTWLLEPDQPHLLHGDLWHGNILTCHNRVSGFIDPALYYGHREMDLAFATLFDSLGPAFFEAYHDHYPITPGFFEVRKDLYNLYPLLVHVRLFGAHYVPGIEARLKHVGL